jgi:hypothetical protein
MTKKTQQSIFFFLLICYLLILFSPLDYIVLAHAFIHFWLTLLYGVFIFIFYSTDKKQRKRRVIASVIALPIVSLFTFYFYIVSPNNEVEITHVPKSKLIITNQFYTLFMMGNPRMELVIGYPILFKQLIWRVNLYTKYGEGENEASLAKYQLPKGIKAADYGLYILEKEHYLLDDRKNKVYKIKKKV